MGHDEIKREQLEFFRAHKAGCAFAALAAKQPEQYGWFQHIVQAECQVIEKVLDDSIQDPEVTMVSLIFPSVRSLQELLELTDNLKSANNILLEQDVVFKGFRCLGFRLKLHKALSWMSGFGNFDFLPQTRQSPHTEISVRVKPRPNYDWVLKEHPETTVHIADLNMGGLSDTMLKKLWQSSFDQTERVLDHKPDLRSASKTTFAIPV